MDNVDLWQLDLHKTGARPYRSHLQPACLECRKRKARCVKNPDSENCLHCQLRRVECVFPRSTHQDTNKGATAREDRHNKKTTNRRPRSGRQQTQSVEVERLENGSAPAIDGQVPGYKDDLQIAREASQQYFEATTGILNAAEDESPHVVGLPLDDDSNELDDNLFTGVEPTKRLICPSSNHKHRHRGARPVMFTTVRRRPLGLITNQSVAASKCEIIEKIVGPGVKELIDVFFAKVNPCFPLFDEASFLHNYTNAKDKISPAVLCNLYANAMIYWRSCPTLSAKICPDIMFVWLQANEALNSETFLSPGLSSVLAIILNIGGRPSTSFFGNGGLLGVAVARANALGLNRDPSDWKISDTERQARINIWWLIVMQDRWSSLAYGTPLQINRKQFDVPVPEVEQLCRLQESTFHPYAAPVFVALITLTEVLGQILEHIYDVVSASTVMAETSSTFESLLSNWEDSQNDNIRRMIFRGTNLDGPGAANLRLAYLGVKFLLKRWCLKTLKQASQLHREASSLDRLHARRAAEEIFHFVSELDERQLRGFWFPMHAYTLTSATSFLIRDALKHENTNQAVSRRIVSEMIAALRKCKEKYDWDLAENPLNSYGHVVDKLDLVGSSSNPAALNLEQIPCLSIPGMEEIFINIDEYVQLEPEDYLHDFCFPVDEQLSLIAPPLAPALRVDDTSLS